MFKFNFLKCVYVKKQLRSMNTWINNLLLSIPVIGSLAGVASSNPPKYNCYFLGTLDGNPEHVAHM